MRQGNKNTRDKAIPFDSVPLDGTVDIGGFFYTTTANINDPSLIASRTKTVLMTRPEKGDIVEAQLFIEMTAPSNKALEVRIGIGRLVESGGIPTLAAQSTYTEDFVNQQHRLLTGRDTPFTVAANGSLFIDANLVPGLLRFGDSNFSSDIYVLLVTFNDNISAANGYRLNKFKVTASAQIGLGR